MRGFPTYVLMILVAAMSLNGCKSSEGQLSTADQGGGDSLSTSELRSFQYAYYDGLRAKTLGNSEEARKLFERALDIDTGSAATHYELARLYADEGRYGTATTYAEKAYELDAANAWYAQLLAGLYGETGQWDEAVTVMRDLIDRDPDNYENYYRLGSLLAAQGKYKEALALFDKVEERFGTDEELSMQRQMIYVEQEKYDLALEAIDQLIAMHPEEIRYWGVKAEILEKAGKNDEAITLYEEMLTLDPDNGLVLLALYEDSKRKGATGRAEEYLLRAFGSNDLNIDVKVNILLNLMSAPSFATKSEVVMELADRLAEAHPDNPKTYAIKGDIHYGRDELNESRQNFRKAVDLDPNRPPIWQQILTIDSKLGDFDAMLAESEEAITLFPHQPVFYLFNGIALLQKKQASDALEILTAGKNLVIDDNALLAQFHSSLGDVHHALGEHSASDQSYEKALRYNSRNVVVLNNYAYYLALRGDSLEKAETMAKKANDLRPDVPGFQDTYAWVLFKRNNYKNALFWIEESLKNGGDNDPTILEHHGDILEALERYDEAVIAWQMALNLGGDPGTLKRKMSKYQNGVE